MVGCAIGIGTAEPLIAPGGGRVRPGGAPDPADADDDAAPPLPPPPPPSGIVLAEVPG